MERPKIKDKAVLAYVEDLERQLENFKSESTITRMYLAVKKQADDMANLLQTDVEVELETGEVTTRPLMDHESLSSKDDKVFDRYFNILNLSLIEIEKYLGYLLSFLFLLHIRR
jgi:hypothetical protein